MTDNSDLDLDGQDLEYLANAISERVQRKAIAGALGDSWGNLDNRDYFDALGYPGRNELSWEDYWAQFERGGIAETIITAPAGQTWSDVPTVSDDGSPDADDDQSAFEADVQELFDETGLLYYLERGDTLQRIGRFGILIIGFDDGADSLAEPVNRSALTGTPEQDILYYQPFSEGQIDDFTREEDEFDARFGLPVEYEVDFGTEHPLESETVHHERVLHIAEGALEDEIIGYSAYRPIFNLLIDLLRVVGGSSEMYWRDAKKRYIAKTREGAGGISDEDKVATQIEEMVNDLRDVAWLDNAEVEEMGGGSPDPSGLKDAILELIAGQTRIPKRRLLGTERGDLASTQDEAAFVAMIAERRMKFAEPQIFRALVDHLEELGILSGPEDGSYDVEWPDNFELTEVERAEIMQRKAKAFKDVASMDDPAEVATVEERRSEVLGLSPERGSEVDVDPSALPGVDDPEADDLDEDVDVDEPLDEEDPEIEDWFEDHFESRQDALKAMADGGTIAE